MLMILHDLIIDRILTGPIDVNCFIIGCPVSGTAAVIDPGGHGERILERLEHNKLTLTVVINTHGHFDHVGGNAFLMRETDADLLLHAAGLPFLQRAREHADMWGMEFEDSPEPTRLLKGGEILRVGELKLEIIHTPGHSPGGISIYLPGHVFTGDALFEGSIGRTDLPGGNLEELLNSIREKILVLPGETVVHPGHGPETTIENEKRYNMFLR